MNTFGSMLGHLITMTEAWQSWQLECAQLHCIDAKACASITDHLLYHARCSSGWILRQQLSVERWNFSAWTMHYDADQPLLHHSVTIDQHNWLSPGGKLIPPLEKIAFGPGRDEILVLSRHAPGTPAFWQSFDRTQGCKDILPPLPARCFSHAETHVATKEEAFCRLVQVKMRELIQQNEPADNFSYLPTIISASVTDRATLEAAWILFKHTDILERTLQWGWQWSRFLYELWYTCWPTMTPTRVYTQSFKHYRSLVREYGSHELAGDLSQLSLQHGEVKVHDSATGWLFFHPRPKDG